MHMLLAPSKELLAARQRHDAAPGEPVTGEEPAADAGGEAAAPEAEPAEAEQAASG